MIIIGKRPEGYLLECTAEGACHSFVVKDLGTTVTCTTCGHEESSVDLATNYVFMRHALKYGKMAAEMLTIGPTNETSSPRASAAYSGTSMREPARVICTNI